MKNTDNVKNAHTIGFCKGLVTGAVILTVTVCVAAIVTKLQK